MNLNKVTVPHCFEIVAKQYLIKENRRGKISPFLLDIGTYWYDNPIDKKNGQFDVVARCKDGYIFYKCKFLNSPINDTIINEEINRVSLTNLKPIKYGFFSKSGFNITNPDSYFLYSLEDLYR